MESTHSSITAKNITNPRPQELHPQGFKSLQEWGSSSSHRATKQHPHGKPQPQNKSKPFQELTHRLQNLLQPALNLLQWKTATRMLLAGVCPWLLGKGGQAAEQPPLKGAFGSVFVEVLWHPTSKRNSRKADTINNNVKQLQLAFLDQWIPANPLFLFRSPPQQSFYFAF